MGHRIWILVLAGALLGGCSSTLETGYVPRKLGDSEILRRAYYADPYSPEAREAEMERARQTGQRRPGA